MKTINFIYELSTWGAFTKTEMEGAKRMPWKGEIVDLFNAYQEGAYDEDIYILIDEIKYLLRRFA